MASPLPPSAVHLDGHRLQPTPPMTEFDLADHKPIAGLGRNGETTRHAPASHQHGATAVDGTTHVQFIPIAKHKVVATKLVKPPVKKPIAAAGELAPPMASRLPRPIQTQHLSHLPSSAMTAPVGGTIRYEDLQKRQAQWWSERKQPAAQAAKAPAHTTEGHPIAFKTLEAPMRKEKKKTLPLPPPSLTRSTMPVAAKTKRKQPPTKEGRKQKVTLSMPSEEQALQVAREMPKSAGPTLSSSDAFLPSEPAHLLMIGPDGKAMASPPGSPTQENASSSRRGLDEEARLRRLAEEYERKRQREEERRKAKLPLHEEACSSASPPLTLSQPAITAQQSTSKATLQAAKAMLQVNKTRARTDSPATQAASSSPALSAAVSAAPALDGETEKMLAPICRRKPSCTCAHLPPLLSAPVSPHTTSTDPFFDLLDAMPLPHHYLGAIFLVLYLRLLSTKRYG